MTLSSKNIRTFHKKIFDWWASHRRDLPWRHTHDPYKIMISEIMLQQTQVSRVLAKYEEFIRAYPTAKSLAQAKTSDVLKLWKGMGYNRRALYLKKAAESVTEIYKGVFPNTEETLHKLPGIGLYTARAILVFAYKKDVAMVDTNIRQIITHFFFTDEKQTEKIIQETADKLVPKGKSWEWHQALMDFGALELKKLDRTPYFPYLPDLPDHPKKQPFRESTRFFRGRIMDLVREKKWKKKDLVKFLKDEFDRDADASKLLLQGLLKDGLIVRSKSDIITLPD